MKRLHLSFLTAILLASTLVLFCVHEFNNPADPAYVGDYRLGPAWNTLPETLYTGATYAIACTTGSDAFAGVGVEEPGLSVASWSFVNDTLHMGFLQRFDGYIVLEGTRPNGKTVWDSVHVFVLDAVGPSPEVAFAAETLYAASGDSATFVAATVSGSPKTYLWRFSDGVSDTTTVPSFTRYFASVGTIRGYLNAKDMFGRPGTEDTAIIVVQAYTYRITPIALPDTVKKGVSKQFIVSVADSATFASHRGKLYWQFVLGADTTRDTTTAPQVGYTAADSAALTLTLVARDSSGNQSAPVNRSILVWLYRPVVVQVSAPDTVNAGTVVNLHAKAKDTDPAGGAVDSIIWKGPGFDTATTDTQVNVKFNTAGLCTVTVVAVDNDGNHSAAVTVQVFVKSLGPVIASRADTVAFLNHADTIAVTAVPGGSGAAIVSYTWSSRGAETFSPVVTTTQPRLIHAFSAIGRDTIVVSCTDANSVASAHPDTFVVTVSSGVPVVTAVSPETVWVYDSVKYAVKAVGVSGTVDSVYAIFDNGNRFGAKAGDSIRYPFTTAGSHTIKAFAKDNNALWSDTLRVNILVKLGKPVITGTAKNANIYINDSVHVTVHAIDTNGTVKQYYLAWLTGAFKQQAADSVFDTVFATAGWKKYRSYVKDDDGISSDTVTDSVNVQLGAPTVDSIRTDSALAKIFIDDTVHYTIKGGDVNGTVDSIFVAWANDTAAWQKSKAVGDSVKLAHAYKRTEAGTFGMRIRVKDNDGLIKDSVMVITVQLGKPIVDSLKIDTTLGNVFIKDNRKFTVFGHDVNGIVDSFKVLWVSSATSTLNSSPTNTLAHSFAVADTGRVILKALVMDNDTVWSDTFRDTVNVRLGAPVLWGDTKDTLWVIINNGPGYYYIHVNSYDTNGTIQKYYWNASAGLTNADSTNADSIRFDVISALVNNNWDYYVYGLDDDGLLSGGKFTVFADEVPPTTTTTTSQPGMPNVQIAWFGLDAKDDSLTQFAVVIGATSSSVTDTVVNFTAAKDATFGKSVGYFTYTFNPQSQGLSSNFYYRIIARDARGSLPDTINTANVMYPY